MEVDSSDELSTSSRGILDPGRMAAVVDFHRLAVPAGLDGLLDHFWTVRWSLPPGVVHRQDLVAYPAVNLSVGPSPPPGEQPPPGPYPVTARVNGVTTSLTARVLSGDGWTIGAKFHTGAFGAFFPGSQRVITDRVMGLDEVWGVDGEAVADQVAHAWCGRPPDQPDAWEEAVAVLSDLVLARLAEADPERVRLSRAVAEIARRVEVDRSIRRVDELAAGAGLSVRTLQRLFGELAGVSPTWVIRRVRLIEAAERARDGVSVQSHLIREFRAVIGVPPGAYATRQI